MGDGDRLLIAVPEGDGDLDEVLCALALDSALTLDFRSPLGYLVASVVRALDCAGRFQYVCSPNMLVGHRLVRILLGPTPRATI